ncbi:MAG: hypothetical protein ACE5OO_05020 [Candidatus Bathyarchaeia archaeon]
MRSPPVIPALMFGPLKANFIASGMGVLLVPPGGMNVDRITGSLEPYGIAEEEMDRLLRIFVDESVEGEGPHTVPMDPGDIEGSIRIWSDEKRKLMEATGRPVLKIVYIDALSDHFPPDQTRRMMEREIASTKKEGGLLLMFHRPGSEGLRQYASNLSDIDLRLLNEQGIILFHGAYPRTLLYAMETIESGGHQEIKLTPMI